MDGSFSLLKAGQRKPVIILDLESVSSRKKAVSEPIIRAARSTQSRPRHCVGHGLAGLALADLADLAEAGDRPTFVMQKKNTHSFPISNTVGLALVFQQNPATKSHKCVTVSIRL